VAILQILLFPFSCLYGGILNLRNYLFDIGHFEQYQSNINTIGVGNLSVGGTGKTPFIAFLAKQLIEEGKKVAIVSRGYGRKTKGLLEVFEDSKASDVGDEPLLLKRKYPNTKVWVSEKRILAMKEAEKWKADCILLDDNFQHRYVKPHFQYMLSRFQRPFFNDYVIPSGRLREFRKGAKRADCVVFTHAVEANKLYHQKTLRYTNAKVRFAAYSNGEIKWKQCEKEDFNAILAVSGIAHSEYFVRACSKISNEVKPLNFGDHHAFGINSVHKIIKAFNNLDHAILICTEKDWVKLSEWGVELRDIPIAVMPIEVKWLP
jgi:tetraacyldisaccharide 4'-kinase